MGLLQGLATPAALDIMLTADASTFDVVNIMKEAVATVQNQAFGVLGIVVPSIVLITGAVVSIRFGLGWLRKIRG